MSHTKGDLIVSKRNGCNILATKKWDEIGCIATLCTFDVGEKEAEANAERMKICWNSHDSLIEALEEMTVLHQIGEDFVCVNRTTCLDSDKCNKCGVKVQWSKAKQALKQAKG